ncbi:MAG: hypothetical protein ACLQIB_10585 [Isosphaeraceae bacterium]
MLNRFAADDLKAASPVDSLAVLKRENAVVATFTRDPCLFAEFRKLRRQMFHADRRSVGFRIFNTESAEDYKDPDDQMLILHDHQRVYGGAYVRISTPNHPLVLGIEQDILPPPGKFYFSLREQFPELELDKYAYAELGRFLLHPSMPTRM